MNLPYIWQTVQLHVSLIKSCIRTIGFIYSRICIFLKKLAFDFVGSAWSIGFFIPATTATSKDFLSQIVSITFISFLNSWERASIFPFECSVINKDTTGTIFLTSLVWRSPWLGIETGTSRTRSQHSTTRLSRRRWTLTAVNSGFFVTMFLFTFVYRFE